MTKTPDEYLRQPYTRLLIPNADGSYSAEMLDLPGCVADGETPNEALHHLDAAAQAWLEACLARGLAIPEPFLNQDFGGQLRLHLPRSLHRQASRLATRDGISLNQFLMSAIAARVGAEDLLARLIEKFEERSAGNS